MNIRLIGINILFSIHYSQSVLRENSLSSNNSTNDIIKGVGQPLFLTPYIEKGDIAGAVKASRVKGLPNAPEITSYSGYLTVNPNYNSNIFFWFFPAFNGNKSAPVLLWLNGGPGQSSMFGLFIENGPLVISKDLTARLRQYTWAQEFSMVYIDSPVGVGFSFTDSDSGYARDETDVARDLYTALQQFFTIFNDYRKNDFYLTGESYAGKYIPSVAQKIVSEGKASNISLKGIAIGNGAIDPISQLAYGRYLYQIGLIDERQRDYFNSEETKAINYIRLRRYIDAIDVMDSLFYGFFISPSYFVNVTGFHYLYNHLLDSKPNALGYYVEYLGLAQTRLAIHVGNNTFIDDNVLVTKYLINDIMQSVKPLVASLLNKDYKVLIYSGNLDIIIPTPSTEAWVTSMRWKKATEYKNGERIIWKVSESDPEVAGYVRNVDNFSVVVVRNSGHFVPYDQPRVGRNMITRFINDIPFN